MADYLPLLLMFILATIFAAASFVACSSSLALSVASSSLATAATTRSMSPAMVRMSVSVIPRVVTAGVPMRMPDGLNGGRGSSGTVL